MILHDAIAASSIADLIESEGVLVHFQPIIAARQRTVIGLEALARGPRRHAAPLPASTLFEMAAKASLTTALERLCCQVAIRDFSVLARSRPELILFLNLGSWVGVSPSECVDALNYFASRATVPPNRIAIEILESRAESVSHLAEVSRGLRASGFLLALDDVGVGHSNLDRIALLKPDVVKVDRGLITGIDTDLFKQGALRCLSGLCHRIGALVVAEGVETAEEAIVALELGADLLQGFFFAPANVDGVSRRDDGTTADIELLAARFKGHIVGKVEHRRVRHREFSTLMNSLLDRLALVDVDQFESVLTESSNLHADIECLYVLDADGTQITSTIVASHFTCRGILFQPAPKGADHSLKDYYYVPREAGLPRYTSDPYVSLASGHLCSTLSVTCRDRQQTSYVLCMDVRSEPPQIPAPAVSSLGDRHNSLAAP